MRRVLAAALLLAGSVACTNTSGGPEPVDLPVPAGFPPMVVPADNPTTREGILLGRTLYYDRRLSPDGSRACADCHLQEHAFSNPGVTGVLPHMNLAWSTNFLWDGHFMGTLEEAMIMEVEEFFGTDVNRLREPDLEEKFQAAFGTRDITTRRAAYALAQFQRTMVSGNSAYDRHMAGVPDALDASAQRGMQLFHGEKGECHHCHATRLFTDNAFHNTGLDAEVAGTGRGAFTGRARDDGRWKTPTLRNVARTGPYMHDDRLGTLEEVVEFYSSGIRASATVDTLMPNVPGGGAGFTAQEKADLVAFLHALTDESFLSNPELARP